MYSIILPLVEHLKIVVMSAEAMMFVLFLAWSAWTACSKKCDIGTQERTRVITHRPSTFCRTPNLKRERDCGDHNGGCEETCDPSTGVCSCLPGYSLLSGELKVTLK